MSSSVSSNNQAQQAWQNYQEIERVITARYHNGSYWSNHSVSMALQRLGEAVLVQNKLNPNDHQIISEWNLRLQHSTIYRVTTTEAMLNERVVEWEEAIERMQAGYDTWTDGRTAAFRPQKSLQETLERDFSEIKSIVDTTPQQAKTLFDRIHAIVQIEINRLTLKPSSGEKISEICTAIHLLAAAIDHKYNTSVFTPNPISLSPNEKTSVKTTDIYSFNTMLDLKIRRWSLRQALNLSSDSLISKLFGLQEALWGQTTSLQNVVGTL